MRIGKKIHVRMLAEISRQMGYAPEGFKFEGEVDQYEPGANTDRTRDLARSFGAQEKTH